MSKRRAEKDISLQDLALHVDEEQLKTLHSVPEILPSNLRCIAPLLEAIRRAYACPVTPHKRSLPVIKLCMTLHTFSNLVFIEPPGNGL